MKSKTKIKKQTRKKRNIELIETISLAKKNPNWIEIAHLLSKPTKQRICLNLEKINNFSKEKETIVVPGKVLSPGEINKKIKIVAFGFSNKTKEKLTKLKIPFSYLIDEIKENSEARDLKILK